MSVVLTEVTAPSSRMTKNINVWQKSPDQLDCSTSLPDLSSSSSWSSWRRGYKTVFFVAISRKIKLMFCPWRVFLDSPIFTSKTRKIPLLWGSLRSSGLTNKYQLKTTISKGTIALAFYHSISGEGKSFIRLTPGCWTAVHSADCSCWRENSQCSQWNSAL